jgi:hypothetical protein
MLPVLTKGFQRLDIRKETNPVQPFILQNVFKIEPQENDLKVYPVIRDPLVYAFLEETP